MSIKKKLLSLLAAGALLATMATGAFADVYYVTPSGTGNGSSWEAAASDLKDILENAANGDEVWVAGGAYTSGSAQTDAFTLKAGVKIYGGFAGTETLRENRIPGLYESILDGQNLNYHVISVDVGATATNTVIDGLTIKGGNANGFSTSGYNEGAAIYMPEAGASGITINNCLITENNASTTVITFFGHSILENSAIFNNTSSSGIIRTYNAGLDIKNCQFIANTGHAIQNNSSNPAVATWTLTIENTLFNGNTGRAISQNAGPVKISNSTFTNNNMGIHVYLGKPVMVTNSTFVNNTTGINVSATTSPATLVSNSIFWDNATDFDVNSSAILTLKDSVISSNPSNVILDGITHQNDPLLVSLDVYGSRATVSTDVYIYAPGNPVAFDFPVGTIISSDFDATFAIPATDQRGVNRHSGLSTVPGSYQAATYYVTQAGAGTFDGSSWTNALQGANLANTMGLAVEGDVFWIAGGTYSPGTTGDDTFTLNAGVKIYGNFAGTETNLAERENTSNESILSGDHVNYTVVTVEAGGTPLNTVIDGFTITGGANADHNGGGMYVDSTGVHIANCTFTGNYADQEYGGGLYANDSAIVLENCVFRDNEANFGGGAYFSYNNVISIKNCVFNDNRTKEQDIEGEGDDGAGIYIEGNNRVAIEDSAFSGNCSEYWAGALYIGSENIITITNTTFAENESYHNGGAIYLYQENQIAITNCTFVDNKADIEDDGAHGYGIYISNYNNEIIIANSILSHDVEDVYDSVDSNIITIKNSIFAGSDSEIYADNVTSSDVLFNTDPLLTSLDIDGNAATTSSDVYIYSITKASPAFEGGLAVGTVVYDGATVPAYDQRGQKRPEIGNVTIGSYEATEDGFIHATSISFDLTAISLDYTTTGGTSTITATVLPTEATSKDVTWASTNPDIATVLNGLVTAISAGPTGQTTVTITGTTHNGLVASADVTVTQQVTGIDLNKSALSLDVGTDETLTATFTPSNAYDKTITWTTSDASIATVDTNGKITAVSAGATGQTTVTITATTENDKTATCTVTVTQKATGVTLNKTSGSLKVGASETLSATLTPNTAYDKTITWSSSDSAIATVDNTGKVTAVSAGATGQTTATITATTTDGGYTATCTYTITQPVTGITLNKTSGSLKVGVSETLTATLNPSTAYDKTITWTSSNSAIATVDNTGKVTAVSAGATGSSTATITATTTDGNYTATCTYTITQPVTGLSLSSNNITLSPGQSQTVTATIAPSNAYNKNITWSTSNSAISLTPSSNGQTVTIKLVPTGSSIPTQATVTATTTDGNHTAQIQINSQGSINNPAPTLPSGTPSNVHGSSSAIVKLPNTATDEQKAAAIDSLSDQMKNIKDSDLEVNSNGYIVATDATIASAILASGIEVEENTEITKLPVFTASVSQGQIAAVSFPLRGSELLADEFNEVELLKIISSTHSQLFTYKSDPTEFADKTFSIFGSDNASVATGEIDPVELYYVIVFIKDGGLFDLDGSSNGSVIDPMVILDNHQHKKSDSSSDCNVGLGLLALLGLIPVAFKKK